MFYNITKGLMKKINPILSFLPRLKCILNSGMAHLPEVIARGEQMKGTVTSRKGVDISGFQHC